MITLDSLTQNTVLSIGKQLENNSTDFIFNAETWLNQFPDGIIALLIRRAEEEDFYVANTGINFVNKTVSWMITAYDTEIPGYNLAEFQLISDGAVRKSATFKIYVTTSLYPGQAPHETPAPQWVEDYLSEFTALHSGTVQAQEVASIAADRAEEARERAQEEADRAKDEADRAESAATGSIEQAEEAAERAAESAQQAQAQATVATNQANRANNYATYANNYANNASRSASSANTQANKAETYATQASNSASSAYQSASLAETAVTNATAQADRAKDEADRAKDEADRAKDEADRAETAADNCENKAPSIEETEGPAEIANFPDGADNFPMRVQVQIEPVQDLHGYDKPWPGGGGKNKLNIDNYTYNNNNVTFNCDAGTVTINTSAPSSAVTDLRFTTIPNNTIIGNLGPGNYVVSIDKYTNINNNSNIAYIVIKTTDTNNTRYIGVGLKALVVTFTVESNEKIDGGFIRVGAGVTCENVTLKPFVGLASESDGTWEPFENICPISGWDKIAVTVSPTTQAADGETKTIDLPQTIYGGTLTINKDGSGEVVVDRAEVTLNGSENWIAYSDQGCYISKNDIEKNSQQYLTNKILYCDKLPVYNDNYATDFRSSLFGITGWSNLTTQGNYIYVKTGETTYSNTDSVKAWLQENNTKVVYKTINKSTIPLTPGQIKSLLGTNNVWSDAGLITVQYTADTKLFIEKYVASVGG